MNTTPILPDELMVAPGFRDTGDTWRFFRGLCLRSILLVIRIRKDTGAWSEDVMDGDFGQPYDYGVVRAGEVDQGRGRAQLR